MVHPLSFRTLRPKRRCLSRTRQNHICIPICTTHIICQIDKGDAAAWEPFFALLDGDKASLFYERTHIVGVDASQLIIERRFCLQDRLSESVLHRLAAIRPCRAVYSNHSCICDILNGPETECVAFPFLCHTLRKQYEFGTPFLPLLKNDSLIVLSTHGTEAVLNRLCLEIQ